MLDNHQDLGIDYGSGPSQVEVYVDGRGWIFGDLRMQWQADDGTWWCEVIHRSVEDDDDEVDVFPADRIRRFSAGLPAAGHVGVDQDHTRR